MRWKRISGCRISQILYGDIQMDDFWMIESDLTKNPTVLSLIPSTAGLLGEGRRSGRSHFANGSETCVTSRYTEAIVSSEPAPVFQWISFRENHGKSTGNHICLPSNCLVFPVKFPMIQFCKFFVKGFGEISMEIWWGNSSWNMIW